ncbi:family 78 glycoside hydrolase catalytic domain [Streptomyces fuscichromogenes]|uniref:family 78 glycoside hydrolase catalytic domain n=1 Tax=Streptomyces fuscichromogenes TaxID=1324013 RepID=UPI00357137AC
MTRTPAGVQPIDFGQNFAGFATVCLSGQPGTTVDLSHGDRTTGGRYPVAE